MCRNMSRRRNAPEPLTEEQMVVIKGVKPPLPRHNVSCHLPDPRLQKRYDKFLVAIADKHKNKTSDCTLATVEAFICSVVMHSTAPRPPCALLQ